MVRLVVCALAGLLVCAGSLLADQIKGKIKSVNSDNTITVTGDDGKEYTIHVDKHTKVTAPDGKELKGGIQSHEVKAGMEVVVETEMKHGKQHAGTINLKGLLNERE